MHTTNILLTINKLTIQNSTLNLTTRTYIRPDSIPPCGAPDAETALGARGGKMAQLEDNSIWQDGEVKKALPRKTGVLILPLTYRIVSLLPPLVSLSPFLVYVGSSGRECFTYDYR